MAIRLRSRLAKRSKLKATAVKIGSTIGRVEGAAHQGARKAASAIKVAKTEISGLTKQLNKSSRRLKLALKS
jgi:hypothetical protein